LFRRQHLGVNSHLFGEILELIEGGIDADQRELEFDGLEIEAPHVSQNSLNPTGGVVPAFTRRAGSVGAPANEASDARATF
jgi:hypothetical protein